MNDENLKAGKATQFTSGDKAVKSGSKGGKASGRARREKANLRKLAQQVLDDSYKDSAGNEYTGAELFVRGLVSNLANPDGKNWSKTMDLLISLTGAGKSKEEVEALKAQAALIQAKADTIKKISEKSDGKLADLIAGLKEDDLHTETAPTNAAVADEPAETT